MQVSLSSEEEAELGFVVRGVQDLCVKLNMGTDATSILPALVDGLVRTALVRAKPDRRLAYLNQWRQFLCCLPDWLDMAPENDRTAIAVKALRQFQLQDQRGGRKPQRATTANCLLLKDGELWYAQVPLGAMPGPASNEPPPADLKAAFDRGEQVHTAQRVTSAVGIGSAEYLKPFYPPGVLKREYNKLVGLLPHTNPISESEEEIVAMVKDVPETLLRGWLKEGVTRSDLALLIAAHRAKMTGLKVTNLPHLHTARKEARL